MDYTSRHVGLRIRSWAHSDVEGHIDNATAIENSDNHITVLAAVGML